MRRMFFAILGMSMLASTPLHAIPPAPAAYDILPEDYVVGAWFLYRNQFLHESGRIIDTGNQGISHSEGQGYGMLMAVAAGDRDSFDRMWRWTERELFIRGDALASWKWDPAASPHVVDANNATDGDLLIAWALLRARVKWGGDAYLERARQITEAVVAHTLVDTQHGPVLLPGAEGFREDDQPDGPIVNPSYWIFPAISDLGIISRDFPAEALIETGLKSGRPAGGLARARWRRACPC
jgi:endoglucanase